MNDYKKYLPSKKFISIILIIIIFVALFFTIKGIIYLFKDKKSKSNTPIPMTVGTLIQKDGNNNGIADWEEYLWGLDPNKNGPENKEFILAKKGTLNQNNPNETIDDSKTITDHEALSREFFATIVSLQQTGNLNAENIKSIADAVGQNVQAAEIPDIYTNNMLKIGNDSLVANKAYHNDLSKLINKYSDADIGNELTIIIQGLNNGDAQALFAAKSIAISYQSFGKDLMDISVPKSLAATHLSMANNYEKTGQTIKDLSSALSDPIVGMKAILNYKKYSDALAIDLEKISELLQ